MTTGTGKVCVVCGKDVSRQKRTKDANGRYYCESCSAGRKRPPQNDSLKALKALTPVPHEVDASEDIATANEAPASSTPPSDMKRDCDNCGRVLGKLEQLLPWENHWVCKQCFTNLGGMAEARPSSQNNLSGLMQNAPQESPIPPNAQPDSAIPNTTQQIDGLFVGMFFLGLLPALGVGILLAGAFEAMECRDDAILFISMFGPWIVWGVILLCYYIMFRTKNARLDSKGRTHAISRMLRNFGTATSVIIVLFGLILMTVIYIATTSWIWWAHWGAVLVPFVLLAKGLEVFLNWMERERCPKCRLYGMAEVVNSEYLGSTEYTTTHKKLVNFYDNYGRVTARADVPMQEKHAIRHYRHYCRCRHCSHEWTR